MSIPSPDDNPSLKRFADKLEEAFKNSFNQSVGRTMITINRKSPRKDELSIISVQYCFPLRCVEWLKNYKERYERFLHTGNPATDEGNAILLHSEGDGTQYPSLFVNEKPLEQAQATQSQTVQQPQNVMPDTAPVVEGPVDSQSIPPVEGQSLPPVETEPEVALYINVAGKNYGPYDWKMCK